MLGSRARGQAGTRPLGRGLQAPEVQPAATLATRSAYSAARESSGSTIQANVLLSAARRLFHAALGFCSIAPKTRTMK